MEIKLCFVSLKDEEKEDKMLEVNMAEIEKIIKEIYIATGIKSVLYDEEFNVIYSYPNELCPFCCIIRENDELKKKCLMCDIMGFNKAVQGMKTHIYNCHMNLIESISPIIKNDTVIGFIMIGQIIITENIDIIKSNIDAIKDKDTRVRLYTELEKMKVMDNERISAVSDIINMCTSYLWLKQLVSAKYGLGAAAIRNYIYDHLCDDLSVKHLCEKFNVSKSSLYSISKKSFGKGISEYIRDIRIDKAKELLVNTKMSISAVSETVGIIDTNYFTKHFKRYTGKTPSVWRNDKFDKQ